MACQVALLALTGKLYLEPLPHEYGPHAHASPNSIHINHTVCPEPWDSIFLPLKPASTTIPHRHCATADAKIGLSHWHSGSFPASSSSHTRYFLSSTHTLFETSKFFTEVSSPLSSILRASDMRIKRPVCNLQYGINLKFRWEIGIMLHFPIWAKVKPGRGLDIPTVEA